MGRILIIVGLLIAGIGVFFLLAERFPEKTGWIGKLPGDLFIERNNFKIYFPISTSILISIFLTLIFWLFGKK